VEDAFVASAAYTIIGGKALTSLNYEWAANMYVEDLPTLENGGATLVSVDVADGDMVVDAGGELVELAAGVSIKDGEGNVIEYAGGGGTMQQMAVTWTMVDGITWSDGEPLKAADMQLAHDINCDPDSGSTSFFVCDRTASVEFTDTTGTVQFVPGYTPSLYYTYAWGGSEGPTWYPSHRVTSDGRTLADVPAAEWATLPEIAAFPRATPTAWRESREAGRNGRQGPRPPAVPSRTNNDERGSWRCAPSARSPGRWDRGGREWERNATLRCSPLSPPLSPRAAISRRRTDRSRLR